MNLSRVVRQIKASILQKNYLQPEREMEDLVSAEMDRIINDPVREGMVLKRIRSIFRDLRLAII